MASMPTPPSPGDLQSSLVAELERRDLLLQVRVTKGVLLRDLLGQIRAAQLCAQRALQRLAKLCSSALKFGSAEDLTVNRSAC